MSDIIWWYGLVCLILTSAFGTLWIFDRSIGWIIDGFKFRSAFFRWYADDLRKRRDAQP